MLAEAKGRGSHGRRKKFVDAKSVRQKNHFFFECGKSNCDTGSLARWGYNEVDVNVYVRRSSLMGWPTNNNTMCF